MKHPNDLLVVNDLGVDNVIHVSANLMYDLVGAFIRVQEYYESPYDELYRRYFTHEKMIFTYLAQNGGFTYFEDWAGFNVPGDIFLEWYERHEDGPGSLWHRERELIDLVGSSTLYDKKEPFYVIGANINRLDDIKHELAHAWFYLNGEYRTSMTEFVNNRLPVEVTTYLKSYLIDEGYREEVVVDEIQAYLATSPMTYIVEMFEQYDKRIPWNVINSMQKIYQKEYDLHIKM